jgi:hypothetical protein
LKESVKRMKKKSKINEGMERKEQRRKEDRK